jgi:hypothetical protein
VFADVNAWSLYPYYKQRLQSAYILERTSPTTVAPMPFDDFVYLDDGKPPEGPELVLCAAANISDVGVMPPGRRSVSFTFSRTEVGGPEVGYVRTPELYDRLSPARQRDVTLPAAMAISGAAVSPAMGKKSMFGFGPLLALLNVRLGVWLPHPNWVNAQQDDFTWRDKPRLQHLFMEVFGTYPFRHPYLNVSDGGHWDNLGLVELLRRGCTEIYCFDASGDHVDTFFTIGEAIALARSELGVDIRIRPDAMRPPLKADPNRRNLLRRLRRKTSAESPAPVAHVCGTFNYLDALGNQHEGRIVIAKAAVTDDVPWDVFAHAEKDKDFPNNSTLEQLFTDERFEAYRSLGRYLGDRSVYAVWNWDKHAVLVTVPVGTAPAVAARLTDFAPTVLDEGEMHTFAISGTDADALFEQVVYLLGDVPLPAGSYAIKRYGRPGDPEKRIKLGTNPSGWR